MICKKCKVQLEENAKKCHICNTSVIEEIEVLDLSENTDKIKNKSLFTEEEIGKYALDFEEKKSPKQRKSIGIFTGLAIGLFLGFVAVVSVFFFMKKQMQNKLEEQGGSTVSEQKQSTTFQGYTFSIPNYVRYMATSDIFYIGNIENTWSAQIGKKSFSYSTFAKNLEALKNNATGQGFAVKSIKETNYGNDSYIVLEMSMNRKNYIGAYTKVSETEGYYILLYNTAGTLDKEPLRTVATILRTATIHTYVVPSASIDASLIGSLVG